MRGHRCAPRWQHAIHHRRGYVREVITVGRDGILIMDGEGLNLQLSIDVDVAVDQTHTVAGQSDDAFYEMLRRIDGISENNDVSAPDRGVGHDALPDAALAEVDLIHHYVIAYQQRAFHRSGRNLKSLGQECNYKERNHDDHQQRLQQRHPALMLPRLPVGLWRLSCCLGCAFCNIGSKAVSAVQDFRLRLRLFLGFGRLAKRWTRNVAHSLPPAANRCFSRCSSAWRAARCSALFLLWPSARATRCGFSSPLCRCSRTSAVKIFLWSGPVSLAIKYIGCGCPRDCTDSCNADL